MFDDASQVNVTSEQIVSNAAHAEATLVDAWGHAHALAKHSVIGRSASSCDLAVLHPTVSAIHARITFEADGWLVVDAGSKNGTYVDDRRVTRARIHDGARIRFGEVELVFATAAPPPRRRRRQTTPSGLSAFRTLTSAGGISVTIGGEDGKLGVATIDGAVTLSRRESALLAVLLARWTELGGAEGAYVAWHELAQAVGFHSIDADSDNVRELVRRLRNKLRAIGVRDLIASRTGAGYCLATRA